MSDCLFCSHQGWSDIVNCLPLINYYSEKYDTVNVLIRADAAPLLEFYIRSLKNVRPVYRNKDEIGTNVGLMSNGLNSDQVMFHGSYDYFRKDQYRGAFESKGGHFVFKFYESYGIPFITIVDKFSFERDAGLENNVYNKFVNEYGTDYIVYHQQNEMEIIFDSKGVTKINLDSRTINLFDHLKVLENAKELHLANSCWAALCYLVNAKYGLLSDKQVFLYPHKHRFGALDGITPKKLENWKVVP